MGANNLSSKKEPKDIANDIIWLAKSVKTDASKVAVSNILPRKGKFNSKVKEVNTHLQDICSSNNLPLITHNNIHLHRHINVKGLHLNSYGDMVISSLPEISLVLLKMVNIILVHL